MRKILLIAVCFVMMLSLCCCGKTITLEEAKAIALKDAKVSEEEASFTKLETEKDLSGTEYEIEFVCPTGKYEYEISGNGKILSLSAETYELPSSVAAPGSSASTSGDKVLTEAEALDIVLKDIGIDKKDVTSSKIHIDTEEGVYVYDVELRVGNTKYEYDINAITGDIVKCEKEIK